MRDMHDINVVHGNIKIVRTFLHLHFGHALTFVQTNILVNAGGHIRIAGLGAASVPPTLPSTDVDRVFHGAAPELTVPQRFRFGGTEVTKASDVYAFGVVAWEVSRACMNSSEQSTERDWITLRFSPGEFRSPIGTWPWGCI